MKYLNVSLLLVLVFLVVGYDSYKILCLFPFNGLSHHRMFDALCKGLAKRGHQIDMISHFPSKSPPENFKDIVDLNGTRPKVVNSFSVEDARKINDGIMYKMSSTFGSEICELMGTPQMQRFIKNAPKNQYDLIITEYFGSPCYLGFGPYLNAPVALAISSAEYPPVNMFTGNPLSDAIFPSVLVDYAMLTNFKERLVNTLTNLIQSKLFFHYTDSQTEMMRNYLGPTIPSVRELETKVSLTLVNSYQSYQGIRPLTPAVVEVGGLHVAENTVEMSEDLKTWMDSAKDGVIYFTLGSLINIETLPKHQILDLYQSFAKIAPVKVLMKVANSTRLPPGLPSNVRTSSWIPQIPVLRHKNTKAFITHGGLMGSFEALHYGVPLIGIPVFADQIRNINIFAHKGMAILMRLEDINKDSMDAALDAILNDPSYLKTAKRESAIFRDRPMKPMDAAIFWIEYVIRNGPTALRSPAIDLSYWQLNLLDVYAFIIGCAGLLLSIILYFAERLYRRTCSSKPVPRKQKRN